MALNLPLRRDVIAGAAAVGLCMAGSAGKNYKDTVYDKRPEAVDALLSDLKIHDSTLVPDALNTLADAFRESCEGGWFAKHDLDTIDMAKWKVGASVLSDFSMNSWTCARSGVADISPFVYLHYLSPEMVAKYPVVDDSGEKEREIWKARHNATRHL